MSSGAVFDRCDGGRFEAEERSSATRRGGDAFDGDEPLRSTSAYAGVIGRSPEERVVWVVEELNEESAG